MAKMRLKMAKMSAKMAKMRLKMAKMRPKDGQDEAQDGQDAPLERSCKTRPICAHTGKILMNRCIHFLPFASIFRVFFRDCPAECAIPGEPPRRGSKTRPKTSANIMQATLCQALATLANTFNFDWVSDTP